MVGLVSGEKIGLVECEVDDGRMRWKGGRLKFRSLLNSGSTHLLMMSQGCQYWNSAQKKGRYRKKDGRFRKNSKILQYQTEQSVSACICIYVLPPLHTLDPSVLIHRGRTAKSVDLTDGTSVHRIDLRSLVRGGGVGVGVCLSQTGRWRTVSDMQSHSQRPLWGGTGWGHPSLYITFSHKDIKPEG